MDTIISVVICAHNPPFARLERVIGALRSQDLPRETWELVVVDSASREPLEPHLELAWHERASCVREDEPGLTRARLRGIREARGSIVIFVDDDNILEKTYLRQAYTIAEMWPSIGAWSGSAEPEFESPPEPWTQPYWGLLAIREVERDAWSNLPSAGESMPAGAGLCVRRDVAALYAAMHDDGRRGYFLDRVGASLLSGGDNDLALCACDLNMGVGVFKELRLTHVIPSGRVTEAYLLRITESIAFSSVLLHALRGPADRSSLSFKRRVADEVRGALMDRRRRRFHRAGLRGQRRALAWLDGAHLGEFELDASVRTGNPLAPPDL